MKHFYKPLLLLLLPLAISSCFHFERSRSSSSSKEESSSVEPSSESESSSEESSESESFSSSESESFSESSHTEPSSSSENSSSSSSSSEQSSSESSSSSDIDYRGWPELIAVEMYDLFGVVLPHADFNEDDMWSEFYDYREDGGYVLYYLMDNNETDVVSDYGTTLLLDGYIEKQDDYGIYHSLTTDKCEMQVNFEYMEADEDDDYESGNYIYVYAEYPVA